ncbi:MAG TPA: hypothetical protein VMH30_09335 [Verrucomicrobiae bacterium]|nr:hypothetical protein [Verrucomicrobiae bacterium]
MKKYSQFVLQPFYPPMEMGRFVKTPATAPAGDTNFFRVKKKHHRAQCWECNGTGKTTIYPLVDICCNVCKGKGYTLELHIGFEMPCVIKN